MRSDRAEATVSRFACRRRSSPFLSRHVWLLVTMCPDSGVGPSELLGCIGQITLGLSVRGGQPRYGQSGRKGIHQGYHDDGNLPRSIDQV
jgi:hypothetical protein